MDESKSTTLLKEVMYYCNEENPTGALLLEGEWGCGKTFFINNTLKSALQDSHVFVIREKETRVSKEAMVKK